MDHHYRQSLPCLPLLLSCPDSMWLVSRGFRGQGRVHHQSRGPGQVGLGTHQPLEANQENMALSPRGALETSSSNSSSSRPGQHCRDTHRLSPSPAQRTLAPHTLPPFSPLPPCQELAGSPFASETRTNLPGSEASGSNLLTWDRGDPQTPTPAPGNDYCAWKTQTKEGFSKDPEFVRGGGECL